MNNSNSTVWKIVPSLKFDVLCFINILTGDEFYLSYYQKEFDEFKDKITPVAARSIHSLKSQLKTRHNIIISAWISLYFSAVEADTIDEIIAVCDDPSFLKENFRKSPYYDIESWEIFASILPDLKAVLNFLNEINFTAYWNETILPKVHAKIAEVEGSIHKYDVIKLNEKYLGFKLPSNEITVFMLYFVRPHGIKITGTRFLTDVAWPFEIVLRNAAHEMMHPPYDYSGDTELRNAIESLRNDPFLMDKIENHNKSFGYNTLDGMIEEDSVQTLEQLINEELGIAVDARKRWKLQDDGIHVFAIALYQLMKQENYNENKLNYRDYLIEAITSGKLSMGKIKEWYDKFYRKA